MSGTPQITWNGSFERDTFASIGIKSFEDFWKVEKTKSGIEYKAVRQHVSKRDGSISRQMTCLKLNDILYYLKRFEGKAYNNAVREYEALSIIPRFGLTPAKLLAYSFDYENKRAMLLFKNLTGCYSLQKLMDNKAPPDVLADFQLRKKEILKNLVNIMIEFHKSKYFYPDWLAKHIFIKVKSKDIMLIDLERFRELKQCPSYYKLAPVRYFIRRKEWKTLGKSLKAKIYTEKFLRKLRDEE